MRLFERALLIGIMALTSGTHNPIINALAMAHHEGMILMSFLIVSLYMANYIKYILGKQNKNPKTTDGIT